jgi:hypothetical protein
MNWRRSPQRTITCSVFDMRTILHVLTKPDDSLASNVIAAQRNQKDQQIKVVDLTKTEPDYARLLEEVFAADSVAVW